MSAVSSLSPPREAPPSLPLASIEKKTFCSDIKENFKARVIEICRIFLKVLVPFIVALICIALFPPIANAIILPFTVLGTIFLMTFYGLKDKKSSEIDEDLFSDENLFPLKEFEWDFTVKAPAPPAQSSPCGIHRPFSDMNCWLNTLLQMLRRDPVICDWLRNPTEDHPLENLYPLGLFMRNYDQAARSSQSSKLHHGIYFVRTALAKIGGREISYSSARQEDIAAGLDIIMDHRFLPEARKVQLREDIIYRQREGFPAPLSNHTEKSNSNWGQIKLPLAKSRNLQSIQDLLNLYFEDVNSEDDQEAADRWADLRAVDGNKYPYLVDRCVRFFERPPEKLWIQIKRFDSALNKNSSPIQLEDEIQIPTREGDVVYRLDSFAIHDGSSLRTGHYYGYVGDYCCNDSEITQPSREEKQKDSQQAYLVLYSRQ